MPQPSKRPVIKDLSDEEQPESAVRRMRIRLVLPERVMNRDRSVVNSASSGNSSSGNVTVSRTSNRTSNRNDRPENRTVRTDRIPSNSISNRRITAPLDMDPEPICPICAKIILGDADDINYHIDECVNGSGDLQVSSGVASVASSTLPDAPVLSASAASLINIDEEDSRFGMTQYTEKDIERVTKTPLKEPSKKQQKQEAENAHLLREIMASPPLGEQLTILQRLIRSLLDSVSGAAKCCVCWETLRMPAATSVNCWHVCCEECWLRTLGTKRLCPQCSTITNPADLRKVFFS